MNKGKKKEDPRLVVDEEEVEEKWKDESTKAKFEKLHEKKMKEYEEKVKKEEKKKEEDGIDSDDESSSSSSSSSGSDEDEDLEDGEEFGWGDNVFEPPSSTLAPGPSTGFDVSDDTSDLGEIIKGSNAAISDLEKSTMDAAAKAMGKEDAEVFKASQAGEEAGAEISIGWNEDEEPAGDTTKKATVKAARESVEIDVEEVQNVEAVQEEVVEVKEKEEQKVEMQKVKKKADAEGRPITYDHSDESADVNGHNVESMGFYEVKAKQNVSAKKEVAKQEPNAPYVPIFEVKDRITRSKLDYFVKFEAPEYWCRIAAVKNEDSPAMVNDILFDIDGIVLKDHGIKSFALLKTFLVDHRNVSESGALPVDVCLLRLGEEGGKRIPDDSLRQYLGKRRAKNAVSKAPEQPQAMVKGNVGAKRERGAELPESNRNMEADEVKKRKLLLDDDDWTAIVQPTTGDGVIDLTIDSDSD